MFAPSAILRLRSWSLIIQLRHQPLQTVEVVEEASLGVFLSVVQDADRATVTARADLAEHVDVFRADAKRQNFAPLSVADDIHAVEVEAKQVWLHGFDSLRQAVEVAVAMVKIVDNPDVVGGVVLFQVFAHGDHVFRLAAPAAVVVDTHLAADLPGFFQGRQEPLGRLLHFLFLRLALLAKHDPELGMKLVPLEQSQGLVMHAPEGEELDAVFLIGDNLTLKLGDVLLPPVVGDSGDAHLRDHGGAIFRGTFLGIERHDAPGGEVGPVKKIGGSKRSCQAGDDEKG